MSAWRLAINVPEPWTYFFRVSSLTYPNLLGEKSLCCCLVSRQEKETIDKCQGLTATPSSGCAAPLVACATLAVEILVSQLPVWFNSMHQRIISNTHFSLSTDLPQPSNGCHASTKQRPLLQAKATGARSQPQFASSCPTKQNELDERFSQQSTRLVRSTAKLPSWRDESSALVAVNDQRNQ